MAVLLLTACSGIPEQKIDMPQERIVQATDTVFARPTTIPTDLSIQPTPPKPNLANKTSSPVTTPIQTYTPITEPTWTVQPGLSLEEKTTNLLELFSTNGGCSFPCWWGIAVSAPLQDALLLSSLVGKAPLVYRNQYAYHISLDELNSADLNLIFYEKDKNIRRIEITLENPSLFTEYYDVFEKSLSLHSILEKYGEPSAILLRVQPRAERDAPITYTIMLIFENGKFVLEYGGIVDTEEPVKICPQIGNYRLQVFRLYSKPLDEIDSLAEQLSTQGYKTVDVVTEMNTDSFMSTFMSEENPKCVETNLDYWK